MKEVRNNEKQRTVINTLRNSFGEHITKGKDNANDLNFKFSFLGENIGEREKFDKTLFSADMVNAVRFQICYLQKSP